MGSEGASFICESGVVSFGEGIFRFRRKSRGLQQIFKMFCTFLGINVCKYVYIPVGRVEKIDVNSQATNDSSLELATTTSTHFIINHNQYKTMLSRSFLQTAFHPSLARSATVRGLAAKAGQAEVVLVGCGAPNRGMGWYHAVQMLEGR